MDGWLKQSTAATVKIGPFIDTDGAATTGLTLSQADIRLSKNGGNMAQKNEATSATHDELGMYDCPIDTTDTNTLGRLEVVIGESGALIQRHTFMVVPANVWDSLFGADLLQVHAAEISNDLITAAAIANGAIDAATFAADVDAEILSYLVDDATKIDASALNTASGTTIPAIVADTNELQTDWADGGRLDLILDARASQASVDDIPTNAEFASGLAGLNDLSAAEVNAEVDAAIETYHLDHLLAATYDPASKPGAADALLNELVENDGGVARYTANALEQAPTGGSAPTAEEIADQVWDEAKAGHVAAGSFGELAAQVLEDTGTTLQAELDGIQADTEDIQSKIGTPAAASVSADILVIDNLVDDLESRLTATRAGYLDNLNALKVKKNTALANFPFKMVLAADHVTPATGLTITATRSLDGAAFAACANSATEISAGWYKINLAAGDLNGDTVILKFTSATADQRDFSIATQP